MTFDPVSTSVCMCASVFLSVYVCAGPRADRLWLVGRQGLGHECSIALIELSW